MRLWRLTQSDHCSLDGAGAALFGGRYSSPGTPLVYLASEAGLAVLVALRYAQASPAAFGADYVLGWTHVDEEPEPLPALLTNAEKVAYVDTWAAQKRTLTLRMPSAVLPEAQIILLNPLHPGAALVPPLCTRPFRFADCLHEPPMLKRYASG